MNEIIAKVKNQYFNILSQEEAIVEDIDFSKKDTIDFVSLYKLDEEQWFKIDNFSNKSYFIEECSSEFSTASINQIENSNYSDISNICIIQQNSKYFQRITPSKYIVEKRALDFSGAPKIVDQRKQVEIYKKSDAIYVNDTDTLYFKDIAKIKRIFPGIEELQREATRPEIESFLEHSFISKSGINSSAVGISNRKRIADIGEKYKNLSSDKQKRLIQYARDKSGIEINDNGEFVISNDTALKNLLYALDQRYYYADIYEEDRMANSVRVV